MERALVRRSPRSALPAPLRYQHLPEGAEVLNAFARAEHDQFQRIFGPGGSASLSPRAAAHRGLATEHHAGERDTAVHDVAGELGRALAERGLDDVHDGADGFRDRVPDLRRP